MTRWIALVAVLAWGEITSAQSVFRAITGLGNLTVLSTNQSVNNSNAWLTNISVVVTNGLAAVTFEIGGGRIGQGYDVFGATQLAFPLTNAAWNWEGQGYPGTTYSLPAPGNSPLYLLVGTPQDSDNDGLTDAYERLVSHSNPLTSNSINPAMLDGWSLLETLDPFAIYDQQNYPNAPFARLGYWRFNTNTFQDEAGVLPAVAENVSLVPDWSGSAACITNPGSWLNFPTAGSGGPNFNPTNGTIRFWIMPYYTAGGTDPDFFGTFLSYGAGGNSWNFFMLNNQLYLGLNLQGSVTSDQLFYPQYSVFRLQSNLWYQFTVTYSPTNIALYTNGSLYVTSYLPPTMGSASEYDLGNGIVYTPNAASLAAGFSIGNNNYAGAGVPVNALLDEFETFNYPLSAQAVAAGFPTFAGANTNVMLDSDYDGRSDLLETLVDGTDPNDPNSVFNCRMGYWRFDAANFMSEQGQLPLSSSGASLVPGLSGTALNIGLAPGSQVTYWDVFTNGWANINCRQGALRFWFKPNWNNQPAVTAPFVYMGNPDPAQSQWSFSVNTSGEIVFLNASNGIANTVLTSPPLAFASNQWMQIALNYGPGGCALFTNGVVAATGGPVTNWPALADRNLGMMIGNSAAGNSPINGQFDEMETFNYQLNSADILADFQNVQLFDTNLTGIPDMLSDAALPASAPFLETPLVVAGVVEAEQFDLGGPGIAYQNIAPNPTNSYRPCGLLITNCDDLGLGFCLDQTRAGEWAQYTINVLAEQNYCIETRVAGIGMGGVFECEFTNNGFYASTGPLTISSTNWNCLSAVVPLTNGIYTMRLRFLTNGTDGAHVGRFNYISIYPWWQAGFASTFTNAISASQLSTANDWLDAWNNASVIQQAIDSLPATGGTVQLPAGQFYLSCYAPNEQGFVNENAAIAIATNNVEIAGMGKTNTTLIAYNRVVTFVNIGANSNTFTQCSNITLRDMTLMSQPHLAVVHVTNTAYEAGQLLGQPYGFGGSQVVANGLGPDNFARNLLISNCQFLFGDRSIEIPLWVSNCVISHCDIEAWGGSNVYTRAVNNFPTNTPNTIGYNGTLGIFVRDGPNYNINVVDNIWNGNTNLLPAANYPDGWIPAFDYAIFASDGLVWMQGSGNFFVARNTILNYQLEAVHVNAGPNAVVGNRFNTVLNSAGACALAATCGGAAGVTGTGPVNYITSFVGNSIEGGRNGESYQGEDGNPPFSINFSGNYVSLFPALPSNDYPGLVCGVDNCYFANIIGNTAGAAGHGVLMGGEPSQVVRILNNNFTNVTYRGISAGTPPDIGAYHVLVARNILGEGSTFHVQLPYQTASGWFLYQNEYLNSAGNSVPPFLDPAGSAAHVSY